jgi:CheY-like chemotaxis protein
MSSLTSKTILVIDDEVEVRLLAKRILEGDGADVIEASTVDQAIEIARASIPHLILTDLEMDEKNGFDLMEECRKDKVLQGIPIMVFSGNKDRSSVERAMSLGICDYILKPFRATILLQKVRKALKVNSFLSRKLEGDQTASKCSVTADILHINEVGFQIQTSVKLPPSEQIQIASEILSGPEMENLILMTLDQSGRFTENKRYLSEVNFVAVSEKLVKKIRALLGDLK